MTTFSLFAVVKVPFPFTDKNVVKRRPALIVSNSKYQEKFNHCILVMITSANNTPWPDDIKIQNLEITGLSCASVIRFKIFTLDERLIIEQMGCLDQRERNLVSAQLSGYLTNNSYEN